MRNMLLNIPEHKNCKNCGMCCGPVPATEKEINIIKAYVRKNKIKAKKCGLLDCCFRDEKNKKCLIYHVRPLVCRLFGVAKGLNCPNGNTAEIDGKIMIETDSVILLNQVDWR